jgi:hypothetical protein
MDMGSKTIQFMKYIKTYEQVNQGITFKEWLKNTI